MKYKTSQNEKKVNWDAENLALVARASSLLFFFFFFVIKEVSLDSVTKPQYFNDDNKD